MAESSKTSNPAAGPAPTAGEVSSAQPAAASAARLDPAAAASVQLRGVCVAPGLVLGRVHLKDHELSRASITRVPLEGVEVELNRFHQALSGARAQLKDLKARLSGKVSANDARILDTHVAYLKDSVFISDVENLILNEQLALEAAISKVISDFDRIFRLVQSETLRERAVDLRDVAIRVLRQLEHPAQGQPANPPPRDYILVARELSIVDMFNLHGEHVQGILTEEGGLTSHAAIFARSMRIPTLTGVKGLLDNAREGDFAIVDATEGLVRFNPDELVRQQYQAALEAQPSLDEEESGPPEWASRAARTHDGERLVISASCGNLPEVNQAFGLGLASLGLFRTELMYLVDKEPPSREGLIAHYAAVVAAAQGNPVTFRLLHADSSLGLGYLHEVREQNPALGRAGVRALLAREAILRRQLQAILVAASGAPVRIAIPFVNDCADVRRIREILFEERLVLRKGAESFQERVDIGVVIETPAAFLGAHDLARESDFLMLSLDQTVQYLLAADRENPALQTKFDALHPFVLRAVRSLVEACASESKPLSVFGVTAVSAANLPFLIGLGLREFAVAPAHLRDFLALVGEVDSRRARKAAESAAASACPTEASSFLQGFRHGYLDD
ncbi:MAG TPA: putative PEP-binding protein [Planctomycetota bacterium]|nr:putative PEP-binding protein [Planctomycetota bacterium]